MITCDDLRLGGTLASTGITGGTSINSTAIAVADWSGVLGTPGLNGIPLEVNGRPGAFFGGDGQPKPRFLTLPITLTRWGASGVGSLTEATPQDQVVANTDAFLALAARADNTPLELDMPDGTSRFLQVRAITPASVSQITRRRVDVPLVSSWPYWRVGGQRNEQTINGADTLVNAGNVPVYDPTLIFAGNGLFTHSDLGWTIQVIGAVSAVTINFGLRTVTSGGGPGLNLIRRSDRDWGRFPVGTNNIVTTVSVEVRWRDQYA